MENLSVPNFEQTEVLSGNQFVRLRHNLTGDADVHDNLHHDDTKGAWDLPEAVKRKRIRTSRPG